MQKTWEKTLGKLEKRDFPLRWPRPLISGELYTYITHERIKCDPSDTGPQDMVRMLFSTAIGMEIFRIRGRFAYHKVDEGFESTYYGYELEFVGIETLVPVNDDGLKRIKITDSNGNEVKDLISYVG